MACRRYDLDDRLLTFAVRASRLTAAFLPSMVGRHAGLQLVRSVTSAAANYAEAEAAESRRDFVHKLRICLKELREARTWLRFASGMELCAHANDAVVMRECSELIAILAASIRTARGGRPNTQ